MSKELFTDKRWYQDTGFQKIVYQCTTCKYFYGFDRCEAFPNGIPKELLVPEFTHKEAFEGDNGIMYIEGDNRNNRRVPAEYQ